MQIRSSILSAGVFTVSTLAGLVGCSDDAVSAVGSPTCDVGCADGSVTGDGATGSDASAGSDAIKPAGDGSGGTGGALGNSNGPCTDCKVHVPSTYSASTPTRLVVALHGDEGQPE